jgi:hypothetical protein
MASPAAAIAARIRAEIARAKNALALEIAANLTEACPVDTGHARANFVPGIEPFAGVTEDGGAAAQGALAVIGAGVDQPIHVTNNVPYLQYLIAGSSRQAPAGWDLAAVDEAVETIRGQYAAVRIDVTDGGTAASGMLPRAVVVSGGDG